jgi:uncharacterized membrane-anchored protein
MLGISISTIVILTSFALLVAYVMHADFEYRKDGRRTWFYKMVAATAGYMFLLWLLRFR